MSISQVLEKQTKSSKTALIYYGKRFSYEDLGKFSRLFAQVFMRLGVKRGDRVAIMTSNVPQFVFAYYGAMLAGAIVTPINLLSIPRSYRAGDKTPSVPPEIKVQIEDAEPSLIIAFDFYFPILKQIIDSMPENKPRVLITAPHEFMPQILKRLAPIKLRQEGRWIKIKDKPLWLYDFNDLLQKEKSQPRSFSKFPGMRMDESEIAQLQYTGGTTGTPKGVMLTHKNLLTNMRQANNHLSNFLEQGEEVVLGTLPFFHMYGLTAAMQITLLEQNGTLILVADPQDIKRWLSWIEEYKVTIIPSIPRLYERLTSGYQNLLKRKIFSTVKIFLNGAGTLPPKTRKFFEEMSGAKILEGYGLSEASPVVSVCTPDNFRENSIGKPLPETEIRIVDLESGSKLEADQEGEIVVRGPQVMMGYWNKPEETAQVLRNGWLNTGDIGYVDADGFLYITDRLKDLVKINGENVFPSKIETLLLKHPEIKEATVVGVPDEKRGEKLVACVVLQDPSSAHTKAREMINKYLSNELASFEMPREFKFVASLEEFKNPLGKILKRQIRKAIQLGSL